MYSTTLLPRGPKAPLRLHNLQAIHFLPWNHTSHLSAKHPALRRYFRSWQHKIQERKSDGSCRRQLQKIKRIIHLRPLDDYGGLMSMTHHQQPLRRLREAHILPIFAPMDIFLAPAHPPQLARQMAHNLHPLGQIALQRPRRRQRREPWSLHVYWSNCRRYARRDNWSTQ